MTLHVILTAFRFNCEFLEVGSKILNSNFTLNVEPENGETGLHLAACKNNEKMISFLLDLGASPNMVDLKGRSPAMRAAEFGHVQALTLLTEADTDLTSKEITRKSFLL